MDKTLLSYKSLSSKNYLLLSSPSISLMFPYFSVPLFPYKLAPLAFFLFPSLSLSLLFSLILYISFFFSRLILGCLLPFLFYILSATLKIFNRILLTLLLSIHFSLHVQHSVFFFLVPSMFQHMYLTLPALLLLLHPCPSFLIH